MDLPGRQGHLECPGVKPRSPVRRPPRWFRPLVALLASGMGGAQEGLTPRAPRPPFRSPSRRFRGRRAFAFGTSGPHRSEKLYLETMGAGVGFIDYDQDGFLDASSPTAAPRLTSGPRTPPQPALYRNNGDGTWSDVTEQAGLRVGPGFFFFGVAVGDYDNDGRPDLYVSGYRRSLLYHNTGRGGFEDVTDRAGVAQPGGLGDGGGLLRLRPGRPAGPAGDELRAVRRRAQRRVWRPPGPSFAPTAIPTAFPGPAQALSQPGRRHLYRRHRQAGLHEPGRQEPRGRAGRPGRRRLDGHIHRQRHAAKLCLLQPAKTGLSRTRATPPGPDSAKTARPRPV